jgi:LPS O-antigen subunit length determinant protein (WzzB/FepE family)
LSGLNLAALLLAAFAAGAYLALVVRAWTSQHAQQRIVDAAHEALDPDSLARLREYIARVDERAMMRLERDSGSTTVYFPRYPQR